jgi:hypothetical protein
LFAVEARKWRTYPDSATAALRIGHLRRCACPEPADSVAQDAKRRKLETNGISTRACPSREISDASGQAGARDRRLTWFIRF